MGRARTGGGAAGGSGYSLQAQAIAYAACHMVAGRPLNWLEDGEDTPLAVCTETGGPGDDLRIELANGRIIEGQAKAGLSRGKELWSALDRLVAGLRADTNLHGVLLVDDRASGSIKTELREGITDLAGGSRVQAAHEIVKQFLARTKVDPVAERSVLERLRVITLTVEDGQPSRAIALVHLQSVLGINTNAATTFDVLTARCLRMIKRRSRLDLHGGRRFCDRIRRAASGGRDVAAQRSELSKRVAEWTSTATATSETD